MAVCHFWQCWENGPFGRGELVSFSLWLRIRGNVVSSVPASQLKSGIVVRAQEGWNASQRPGRHKLHLVCCAGSVDHLGLAKGSLECWSEAGAQVGRQFSQKHLVLIPCFQQVQGLLVSKSHLRLVSLEQFVVLS